MRRGDPAADAWRRVGPPMGWVAATSRSRALQSSRLAVRIVFSVKILLSVLFIQKILDYGSAANAVLPIQVELIRPVRDHVGEGQSGNSCQVLVRDGLVSRGTGP
jgi:hypothetical protein